MSTPVSDILAASPEQLLAQIAACPACRASLNVTKPDAAQCPACGATFRRGSHVWPLLPPDDRTKSSLWRTWEQLQENGVVSYEADPLHNLSVGKRKDCANFARFCGYHGVVLDVGCGPQDWPAYLDADSPARFVGIDPLASDVPTRLLKVRALAEFLPFREGVFDQVIFATTLDHFVDPTAALAEANRVCRAGGTIEIWFGHKRSDAPRPATSPEWYRRLRTPEGADDQFHIKRLDMDRFFELIGKTPLKTLRREDHAVDEYRTNYFVTLGGGVPWKSS